MDEQGLVIRRGDVFRQRIAGGGGYGDPLLRDPASVARDASDGYIAGDAAAATFGVVVDADGQVDATATVARRSAEEVAIQRSTRRSRLVPVVPRVMDPMGTLKYRRSSSRPVIEPSAGRAAR